MSARKILSACFLLTATLGLAGCFQSPQATAYQAIAAAQGFLQQAQANHGQYCEANPNVGFPCVAIHNAVVAENMAVDALETYCSWTIPPADPKAACTPVASAKAALLQAVANLTSALNQYKDLSGGKP